MSTAKTVAAPRLSTELLAEGQSRLQAENPAMSIRSVARLIGISPSYWSKILRGQKRLSMNQLANTVKALRFDLMQIAELQKSLLFEIAQNKLELETGLPVSTHLQADTMVEYSALGKSHYWLLEKWFYLPLLNLVTCSNFQSDSSWIAARLGLAETTVDEAISNLQRAGFLEINADGHIQRTQLKFRFPTDRSHPQIRKYHQVMLEKAQKHLSEPRAEMTFDQRLIAGVNFAGDSKKIAEARLILERAMYEVANLLADSAETDETFQINVQLYPLTRTPVS